MTTTTDWRPVVAATLASRRADCGHPIPRHDGAFIWLRTERAGSNLEVWSVCTDCHTDTDYQYWDGRTTRPYRDRREYL